MFADGPWLNGKYTIFGKVVSDRFDAYGRVHLVVQVGLQRIAEDRVALVGLADPDAFRVDLGKHGDAGDAQLFAGADNAQGDLAAVGDQYFADFFHVALRFGHPQCPVGKRMGIF